AELEEDLAALLGRREQVAQDFKTPLTEADVALSRFFFIERAQALRDGVRLQTFEFLHATFAEYLAARLTVHLVMDLVAQRPALSVLYTPASDDLLYALLSFAPLSSRQILRFVRAILASRVESTDLNALADVLIAILSESAVRAEHKYANYLPRRLELTSRHGIYSANLVLLSLAL